MHVIAAKAVAFGEALQPEFKQYIQQVKKNASVLGEVLMSNGIDIVTGGTDSHMVLVDLRSKNVTGKDAEESLERAGMTCNKNGVANDPNPPTITSGIRLGSPAAAGDPNLIPEVIVGGLGSLATPFLLQVIPALSRLSSASFPVTFFDLKSTKTI